MTKKTKAKFTTGPWFPTVVVGQPTVGVVRAIDSICGFRNMGDYTEEEFEANVHLVAAAPELYEALEEIISKDRLRWDSSKYEALLAKARGEEPERTEEEARPRGHEKRTPR